MTERPLHRAMVLREKGTQLELEVRSEPDPRPGAIVLRVECCAVCRTDLHVVDGELPAPALPLVPGHQIVGIEETTGRRYGVPWLGWSCGECVFCRSGRENLCEAAKFTGYTLDGGFADYVQADRRYCFPIPPAYSAAEAAPLLCGGLIGYRAYRMTGEARTIGFYGFGSAAHILIHLAKADGREVYAFTREHDEAARRFSLAMGAVWAGSSTSQPPVTLDAAIIFAADGALVPAALRAIAKGGVVVCAGIHMSDIPSFPYELLWGERCVRSVANLTRRDGIDFFERVSPMKIETQRTEYPLEQANEALRDLRAGRVNGTAVLRVAEEHE